MEYVAYECRSDRQDLHDVTHRVFDIRSSCKGGTGTGADIRASAAGWRAAHSTSAGADRHRNGAGAHSGRHRSAGCNRDPGPRCADLDGGAGTYAYAFDGTRASAGCTGPGSDGCGTSPTATTTGRRRCAGAPISTCCGCACSRCR